MRLTEAFLRREVYSWPSVDQNPKQKILGWTTNDRILGSATRMTRQTGNREVNNQINKRCSGKPAEM